jgi:hypothetical protein
MEDFVSEKKFEEMSIMDIIEAGLLNQGIEQQYIDEAKRQIVEEFKMKKLSPESRKEFLKGRYKKAMSAEASPMPSQSEINAIYEKDAQDRVEKTDISGVDFAKLVKFMVNQPPKSLRTGAFIIQKQPKKSAFSRFLSSLAFWR